MFSSPSCVFDSKLCSPVSNELCRNKSMWCSLVNVCFLVKLYSPVNVMFCSQSYALQSMLFFLVKIVFSKPYCFLSFTDWCSIQKMHLYISDSNFKVVKNLDNYATLDTEVSTCTLLLFNVLLHFCENML